MPELFAGAEVPLEGAVEGVVVGVPLLPPNEPAVLPPGGKFERCASAA